MPADTLMRTGVADDDTLMRTGVADDDKRGRLKRPKSGWRRGQLGQVGHGGRFG